MHSADTYLRLIRNADTVRREECLCCVFDNSIHVLQHLQAGKIWTGRIVHSLHHHHQHHEVNFMDLRELHNSSEILYGV